MKSKISTYVQLYLNNVELNISVTKNLKGEKDRLKNFGWFEISDGTTNAETCSWDNLSYFFDCTYEGFKNECILDIRRCGFKPKEIFRDINKLLKRSKKLKLINYDK